jgi:hypothetical protein
MFYRTGALRERRSLRDFQLLRVGVPLVGVKIVPISGRATRSSKKACERPPYA